MAKAKIKEVTNISVVQHQKFKDRKFMLLLYPDNENHRKAYETIISSYDYASILHDKDLEDDGITLKKPHWHVIITTGNNPKWSSALASELGIETRFIEKIKKVDRALEYLVHFNEENKHHYDIDAVNGVLKKRLQASINSVDKTEGEKVSELIQYIKSQSNVIMYSDFSEYCAVNGYWDVFRRAGSIFIKIIDEHNDMIKRLHWENIN